MLFKYFFDEQLAHASYMVGCPASGEVVVIDPIRNIEPYIRFAKEEDLVIVGVLETHIHDNYISGSKELAVQLDVSLYVSGEGDESWTPEYLDKLSHRLLKEGDVIEIGSIAFQVLHTPGHTPESISFLVTDYNISLDPIGIFTGDFVLVGDVGSPALEGASAERESAIYLFESIQRFKQLPDHLQIWPSHRVRSENGKIFGSVPFSTVGYEKRANWAMLIENQEDFIQSLLLKSADALPYSSIVKQMNKEGPALINKLPKVNELKDIRILEDLIEFGAQVVDTRSGESFAKAHIEGTINIPFCKSFPTWAGSVVDYQRPLYLIIEENQLTQVLADLRSVGINNTEAYIDEDFAISNTSRLVAHETIEVQKAEELVINHQLDVLDVRSESECLTESNEGSQQIQLNTLTKQLELILANKPIILMSESKDRLSIATSILHAHGFNRVYNLFGGFNRSLLEKSKSLV